MSKKKKFSHIVTTVSLLGGCQNPGSHQWLFLVPLKGGRDYIFPQLAVYTTYIPLIVLAFVWVLYNPYHLLGEPETAIDHSGEIIFSFL